MAETPDFDNDPEALAWARSKVERVCAQYEEFEREMRASGDEDGAMNWRMIVNVLRKEFLGGRNCVIAAFDERRPQVNAILAKAVSTEQ